jgi:hypothetical protein
MAMHSLRLSGNLMRMNEHAKERPMPRVLRWTLVLFALMIAVTGVYAQPRGGGAGTPTPEPGSWIPRPVPELPELDDFDDVLANPQQALDEFQAALNEGFSELIEENREAFEANRDAFPAAISSTAVRLAALVFGLIVLVFPDKTKVWAWVFVGIVLALILMQLPVGEAFKNEIASDPDMRFMRNEPLGSIVFVAIGALMGLSVLTPLFYFGVIGAGSLAGAAIATQIGGGAVEPALITVGAFVGFILTTIAVSRAGMLVPLAVGAALVALALGLSPALMLPIIALGGFVAMSRSSRFKQMRQREKLPTLQLKEGKVMVGNDRLNERHLHETHPAMADDRDNPLIKR